MQAISGTESAELYAAQLHNRQSAALSYIKIAHLGNKMRTSVKKVNAKKSVRHRSRVTGTDTALLRIFNFYDLSAFRFQGRRTGFEVASFADTKMLFIVCKTPSPANTRPSATSISTDVRYSEDVKSV